MLGGVPPHRRRALVEFDRLMLAATSHHPIVREVAVVVYDLSLSHMCLLLYLLQCVIHHTKQTTVS
jgi:hypothetical protein